MSDYEKEHLEEIQSNCFWAGFLSDLPDDRNWAAAATIVEDIKFAMRQANGDNRKHEKALPINSVVPSAFNEMTDEELEQAEQNKLNEIAELHKEWKAILNEQFYRKHPECKPH